MEPSQTKEKLKLDKLCLTFVIVGVVVVVTVVIVGVVGVFSVSRLLNKHYIVSKVLMILPFTSNEETAEHLLRNQRIIDGNKLPQTRDFTLYTIL